jgi:hypothetical protein
MHSIMRTFREFCGTFFRKSTAKIGGQKSPASGFVAHPYANKGQPSSAPSHITELSSIACAPSEGTLVRIQTFLNIIHRVHKGNQITAMSEITCTRAWLASWRRASWLVGRPLTGLDFWQPFNQVKG